MAIAGRPVQEVKTGKDRGKELDCEKKGAFLARRKKHSTLTAGVYYPKPEAIAADYWGVFVDNTPYILLVPDEDRSAREKAERLAESANFRTLLEATNVYSMAFARYHLFGDQAMLPILQGQASTYEDVTITQK